MLLTSFLVLVLRLVGIYASRFLIKRASCPFAYFLSFFFFGLLGLSVISFIHLLGWVLKKRLFWGSGFFFIPFTHFYLDRTLKIHDEELHKIQTHHDVYETLYKS